MRSDWRSYLADLGALIDDDHVDHFGAPEEEIRAAFDGLILADLSHLGLIRVSGPDALSFLQGQFCNDLHQLSAETSQINGYANPKGRLIAVFRCFLIEQDYYLLLPQNLISKVIERLSKYILRAKVKIDNASNDLGRIGIAGEAADNLVATYLSAPPETVNALSRIGDVTLIRIPGVQTRYLLIADHRRIYGLWSQLMSEAQPVGEDAWSLLDIRAGIPSIYLQTSEAFVPQMVNLDRIDGLSLKKGCYPGQEIVARMHYLGKLKRRMYRFRCAHGQLSAGMPVHDGIKDDADEAGMIVDARPHPEGGCEGLAVLRIDAEAHNQLQAGDQQTALQILPLPYSLDTDKAS